MQRLLCTSIIKYGCFLAKPSSLCYTIESSYLKSSNYIPKFYLHTYTLPFNVMDKNTSPLFDPIVRHGTIFTSVNSDDLWLGVTGPKGNVKKRARGKRRVKRTSINLNFGQRIGKSRSGIKYPGLSEPLFAKGGEVNQIAEGVVDEEYFEKLDSYRQKSSIKKKRKKLPPLARGWTGSRLAGQSLGPPSADYPDFDCRILEGKIVATMNATVGRLRRFSIFVAVGNGKGLCGVGKASSVNCIVACRRAKQRACQNIVPYELKDNRTLWHVGYRHEWGSKIFAKPRPEGCGLTCHRVIRTVCKLVGIKDMYAKVERSTKNYQVITRGFLHLLAAQETYKTMANRLGLNVVEFSPDRDLYPYVLASPSCGHTIDLNAQQKIQPTELTNAKAVEKPIIAISHPNRSRPKKPKPESYTTLVDDLVDVNDGKSVELDDMELIVAGERNINAIALKGRVPAFKGLPVPGYLKDFGNRIRAEERYRYRNYEASKLQREVHAELHKN